MAETTGEVEDRGDDFVPTTDTDATETTETTETTEGAVEQAPERDDKGRFVKTVAKAEPAKTETEEAEEAEEKVEAADATETEEAEVEVDEAAAAAAKASPKTVPYERFKEVIEQKRAIQAQLDQAKTATKQETKADDTAETRFKAFNDKLDKLYEDVEELRADGKAKEAAKVQREIDSMNRELSDAKTAATARREAFAVQIDRTYNGMLDYLETVRPVMNPDAPEFDKRVVQELEFQVQAYEKMGMNAVDSLRRACAMLFDGDPFSEPVAKEKPAAAATTTVADKKTNIEKNVTAARKTPPQTAGTSGTDSGKINPVDLSDDDFDKLPETKKRELRGDMV